VRYRVIEASLAGAAAWALLLSSPAPAAVPHPVQPGETLWSIAAANNFTTRTVAVYNGLSEDASLVAGTTVQIPTEAEGAEALAAAGVSSTDYAGASPSPPVTPSEPPVVQSAPGMGHVPSPAGELHLAPAAADAWNAMREESFRLYGVDLHPAGPLSAYRTYEQQAYLYDLFLIGQGPPASPPGTSAHELGTAVDVATPEMRWVIDQIGWRYGWAKTEAPDEWWHLNYVGG
jgi:LysM repeat protein